jgi:DNA-binding NtrC family response regulator
MTDMHSPPSLSPIDILIAHESVASRRTLAVSLTAAGYVVAEAGHLEAGFDALYGGKPQLAIVNARMPNRAALKLALAAKARGAKLLVIDDSADPHETALSIRAFTDAHFVERRGAIARMAKAAAAIIGPPGAEPSAAA